MPRTRRGSPRCRADRIHRPDDLFVGTGGGRQPGGPATLRALAHRGRLLPDPESETTCSRWCSGRRIGRMTTRPDKRVPDTLSFPTNAVHAGNEIDAGSGAIRTPIIMANSYALPEDPSQLSWS